MAEIIINLNGKEFSLEQGSTVAMLVDSLELINKRIAVELNKDIVPKSMHADTVISAGDVIEVVHAIGGG